MYCFNRKDPSEICSAKAAGNLWSQKLRKITKKYLIFQYWSAMILSKVWQHPPGINTLIKFSVVYVDKEET